MRILQASPQDPTRAVEMAWLLGCTSIAWDMREDCEPAVKMARSARLKSEGWYSVARDPESSAAHPEWMHAPHRREWLNGADGVHLVAPYISLNNVAAFEHARAALIERIRANPWCAKLWLSDLQGSPSGCGCGNPSCRSWDNSPGAKLVEETPFDLPDQFFSEIFFESVMQEIWQMERPLQVNPIICPECERGVAYGNLVDVDGPSGTNLCRGVDCFNPCASDYGPELINRFRSWGGSLFIPHIGLLLMCDALGKNHSALPDRIWPHLAHERYGRDLFPCIEAADADRFESCMILLDAPQDFWPVAAPASYEPALPTVNA